MRRIYEKGCRWVNSYLGPNREEYQDRRKGDYQDFLKKKKELRKAGDKLRETEIAAGRDSSRYRKRKEEYEKAKERFKKAEEKYKKKDFKRTMSFTGMD
ncbi:MAG: hypothetical protein ACOC55_05815, partial [Candidatus Natronoplasma sp.]